ncbi:hypothetical protein [Actinomadura sp. WMMA1423]|uniref:hypothetical protein n=1 Tax=Actinomadura sp. WMMA1423 TaxID=2591108 RepID=UPI0011463CEC|nr:hypothetical protein [Actinomadura sp. WMMA1423]
MDLLDLPLPAGRPRLRELRVVGAMTLADVIGWTGTGFAVSGGYFTVTTLFSSVPEREHIADGFYALGLWLAFIANVIDVSPVWSAIYGLAAAYYTWRWWKNRRNGRGRKALRELGAKSRARVQALVDRMTPSPIPSPAGALS